MTRASRSVLLGIGALVLLAGVGTPQAWQTTDTRPIEQAVLRTHSEMERAAEAVDVDRLFTFVLGTDKGSIIQNGAFLATREEALQRVTTNMRGVSKIAYRWKRQHVTVLSADVALLTAEGESIMTTKDGQVVTTPFAQTVVFVLREGQWKALHAHQSSPQAR